MKETLLKYGSRKFIATVVQCGVLVILPIIYKKFDISNDILTTVLIATSTLVGAYTGLNVLQKSKESGQ